MRVYNFNKNKITRSLMLTYFVLRLKTIYATEIQYNISLEMLDGSLGKYCIYSF